MKRRASHRAGRLRGRVARGDAAQCYEAQSRSHVNGPPSEQRPSSHAGVNKMDLRRPSGSGSMARNRERHLGMMLPERGGPAKRPERAGR